MFFRTKPKGSQIVEQFANTIITRSASCDYKGTEITRHCQHSLIRRLKNQQFESRDLSLKKFPKCHCQKSLASFPKIHQVQKKIPLFGQPCHFVSERTFLFQPFHFLRSQSRFHQSGDFVGIGVRLFLQIVLTKVVIILSNL